MLIVQVLNMLSCPVDSGMWTVDSGHEMWTVVSEKWIVDSG